MNDFKKLIKITWKRFSLRILLLSLFAALFNGLYSRNSIDMDYKTFKNSIIFMADTMGDTDIKNYEKITPELIEKTEELTDNYAKKFKLKRENEIKKLTDNEASDYYNKIYNDNNLEKITSLYDYDNLQFVENGKDVFGIKYFKGLIVPIIILIVIFSMIITSLEQSFPYYEFTMMMPRKKCDEVWMKSIIVFLISAVILFVSIIIEILVLKSSPFAGVFHMGGLTDIVFRMLFLMLTVSIFAVSTGMIAGNFLGHIGLSIVAIGSIQLVMTILEVIVSIFNKDLWTSLDGQFYNFVKLSSDYLKPFISLIYVTFDSSKTIVSFFIITLIIAITSYLVNKKVSAEKSGFMITSRPIEILCKVLAIFSLSTILYMIVTSMLYENHNIFINLSVYILSLLISYKLFDILFKIRIKF